MSNYLSKYEIELTIEENSQREHVLMLEAIQHRILAHLQEQQHIEKVRNFSVKIASFNARLDENQLHDAKNKLLTLASHRLEIYDLNFVDLVLSPDQKTLSIKIALDKYHRRDYFKLTDMIDKEYRQYNEVEMSYPHIELLKSDIAFDKCVLRYFRPFDLIIYHCDKIQLKRDNIPLFAIEFNE